MRVVLLSELFGRGMGYLENVLPKYLARLGVETYVLATDLPLDYRERATNRAYKDFSERLTAGTVETSDGFHVHILGHRKTLGYMRIAGLRRELHSIRPDIVQTMTPIGWIAMDAAWLKFPLGYRLFTGCHYHASVFPLAAKDPRSFSLENLQSALTRTIPGRLVSLQTELCYAITVDCADIAVRFFGVQSEKIRISPLGVDTEVFHPASSDEDIAARRERRHQLGFADSEIVCVYAGRFDNEKNPELLARAVEQLSRTGFPFRGLFVGNGAQAGAIASRAGCVTHPFVPFFQLRDFYRAADIAVWPAQESMSMLDAAACGLPIVANHTMSAAERIDGNGISYRLNDLADMVQALLALQTPETRRRMGLCGAQKIARNFSWESVAKQRLRDYEAALSAKRSPNLASFG